MVTSTFVPRVRNPKNAAGIKLVVVLIVIFLEYKKMIIKIERQQLSLHRDQDKDNKELS